MVLKEVSWLVFSRSAFCLHLCFFEISIDSPYFVATLIALWRTLRNITLQKTNTWGNAKKRINYACTTNAASIF